MWEREKNRLIKLGSGAVAVLWLTACASTDTPLYVKSEEVDALEVPPGLDEPLTRNDYDIPGYYLPQLAGSRDTGLPPRVQSSVEAESSIAQIRFGATGLHLEVEASQAAVAEELAYILDHEEVGLILNAVDSTDQRFEFVYRHVPFVIPRSGFARLAIWRDPEVVNYAGEFIVEVVAIGEARSRIELLDAEGRVVEMDQAEHILSMLRDALG